MRHPKPAGMAAAIALGAAALSATSAGANHIGPITNATVASECSACHMAYQPGFLPQASWRVIMANLSDHFGEDASLDPAAETEIRTYLINNAPVTLRGVDIADPPLRITDLRWFRNEHGSRTRNRAKKDPNIGSISNCTGCHRGAERGYFDDD